MDESIKQILIDYVVDQYLDKKNKEEIRKFCSKQPPLSITVYRGHGRTRIINPGLWYSATIDINIASNEFAGNNCCIFIIHLIDIPCIDINKLIGDKIGEKKEEKEIIFLGGGKFYKNKELTEEGYLELGNKQFNKLMFECWYSLLPKIESKIEPKMQVVKNNVEHILSIIDPNEYEFITSIDDIITDDKTVLTTEEKQKVFDEIQKRKLIGGKKRKLIGIKKRKRTKIRKTKQKKKERKRNKTCKKRRLKCKKM